MKDVLITAVRKTEYKDLMEQYENPIEHACDVKVGDVFVSKNGQIPDGFCPKRMGQRCAFCQRTCARWRKFLRRMDEKSSKCNDFVQRWLSPGELLYRSEK